MNRDRWFGTPVGAALLVGAVAGGVVTVMRVFVQISYEWGPFSIWRMFLTQTGFVGVYFALLAIAPAVCLRSGRKLFGGLLVGAINGAVTLAVQVGTYYLVFAGTGALVHQVLYCAGWLSNAAIFGYATARIYGLPVVRWKCLWMTAVCAAVSTGIWMAFTSAASGGGRSAAAFHSEVALTLTTVSAYLMVLPPALIVERQMARSQGKGEEEKRKEPEAAPV